MFSRGGATAGSAAKTVLCREGFYYMVLLAVIFVLAALRQINLLLVLAGMLLGPLVFHWRLAVLALRGLKVMRRMPPRVCAGDLLVVSMELINSRPSLGSWAVLLEDEIRREGRCDEPPVRPRVLLSYIPAGRSSTAVYGARLPRRGRYRFGPVTLSTGFPFGLLRRTVRLELPEVLYVFPRLGRLTRRWVLRHREAFEGLQRRERRQGQMSGDLFGVRPWRHGDSRRWIHWRASARHGTLVVRQFERYRTQDVAVLVDLWQPDAPTAEQSDNVELAVSFAATLVDDLCRRAGGNLLVGIAGEELAWAAGPASPMLLEQAMEMLAVAEPALAVQLPQLVHQALRQIDPAAQIVLFTTRPAGRDEQLLPDCSIAGLPGLPQRARIISVAGQQWAEYFQLE